ncbi:hypothetical protein PZ897_12705 [Hoeflea sp. YIM 152468]|uniref:hypothetical protein n=1 Tax=Hoeflea sp. YIM 152468 TaxID=3031759 RepID=UPI0023D9B02F|nr:hypothetical protein [Hoeflea sp. YIM 152468]MDF1609038.1 hypothetical protein [Hoeflea sp. YIM 152468]
MRIRPLLLPILAVVLSACTTASVASNPIEARWNGKSAGDFFAAFGPQVSDTSGPGGTTLYTWRGGFGSGRPCTVQLTVGKDYTIRSIQAVSDRRDPKGGPSHCEKTLDAA